MNDRFSSSLFHLLICIAVLGCTDSTLQLPAPQKIGHNERTRVISGSRAANVINKMHGQSVAADANAIVEYGKDKKDILYISYYEDNNRAREAFHLMIEKMATAKKGPFFHLMPLSNYEKKAYFALGMGASHYVFSSGNYLLWLQTFQSFGGELPPRLLKLYPLKLKTNGAQSEPTIAALSHM
jgi:hypothetical protein